MNEIQTQESLLRENEQLCARLEELEETLRAIRSGEVDALVVSRPEGEQVYTLKGALDPYRVMVEAMNEGAVTLARDGSILYCNNRFAQLIKTPHEQIIGQSLHRWIAAQSQNRFREMLARGWTGPVHEELTMQAGDESRVEVRFSMNPLPDSAGSGIAAVITDLTDMFAAAEAELRLCEAEDRFKYIFDHSPIGKSITSPSGGQQVNQAFCEMLGYTEKELQHRSWQDITHPDDIRATQQEVDALLAGKQQSARFVKRFLHKNGSVVWADVCTSLRRDEAGKPLYFMTHVMDITERKLAEQTLSIAHERFSTIFNQAPLGIALIDSYSGRIHEVNPRFAEIAGRTIEEMMHIDWMSITHPDDVQEDLDNMALLNSGRIPGFNMDKRYIRPDGSVVWINMTIAPLKMEKDVSPRHLCMIDDITERKLVEEELTKYHQQLEEMVRARTGQLEAANKELEAFSYSVSHDLRAPLRAIAGFVELLKRRNYDAIDDKGRHYMDVIAEAAVQMSKLIDDILTFSRIGRVEMARGRVNLAQVLEDVLNILRPQSEGRQIEWRIAPLPEVAGDRSMLALVLQNLLANALKFTRTRERALVEVGVLADDPNETVCYVRDNGVGFDMQYSNKLFGLFQRLHPQEQFEGTGVGLANVQRIVQRHGGRAWAEGRVDEGATFYFALPKSGGSHD